MKVEEWVALGGFISIVAGSLSLVIKQLEASRCSKIKMCGCIDCDRKVPEEDIDDNNNNNNNP